MAIIETERRRGRPKGTDFRRLDFPLHEEMRRKLELCEVPSKMAAAKTVVDKAYGDGTRDSKVTRLVRTYPRGQEDNPRGSVLCLLIFLVRCGRVRCFDPGAFEMDQSGAL